MNFLSENNELSINEKLDLMVECNDDKNILLKKISDIFDININHIIDINNNVINDLNIFYDSEYNTDHSIFNKINYTKTLYGEYILKVWLSSPIKDIKLLKNRQNNIKKIIKNNILYQNIDDRLKNIKFMENKVLWFWDNVSEDTQSLYDIVYFKFPIIDKFLNNNEFILNASNIYKIFLVPSFTVFIPILSFLLPYLLLLLFGKNIQFGTFIKFIYNSISYMPSFFNILPPQYSNKAKYFSIFMAGIYLLLYLQSGYYSLRNAYDTNNIINTLHKKINTISYIIKNINEIYQINNKQIDINLDIEEDLQYFNELFSPNVFHDDPKIFNNKGKILSIYHIFLENKERLINILKYLGEIDIYISLANLYKNFNKKDNKYCFVKYVSNNRPYINANNLWHPSINDNPVTNSIILGNKNKNILITGPNKAGKSIFIKSTAISVLFSQTIGLVCASKYQITPFQILNSYLHIPDSAGYQSLFEAEMYRAKDHINKLKKLDKNYFAFIIMDEIFTSTNYVEGYSAAYAIIKKLSQFENSLSLITTHFTTLSNMEKEVNEKIKNYKFSIERNKKNEIIYPHKLERGYSNQYIALELLKNNNFDKDIIDDAIKIVDKIKITFEL